MPAKKRTTAKTKARDAARAKWRKVLYKKTYVTEAWDWKENPRYFIRSLFGRFGLRPSLKGLNPESPEAFIHALAREHHLREYDLPSVAGSDVYGFILSREPLAKREIQQIDADYWGEDFDEVYDPTIGY